MQRTILKKTIRTISTMALLTVMILGTGSSLSAQFTFMGDYDKLFAAPLGYYVDPQEPDPSVSTNATAFYSGATTLTARLMPDSAMFRCWSAADSVRQAIRFRLPS